MTSLGENNSYLMGDAGMGEGIIALKHFGFLLSFKYFNLYCEISKYQTFALIIIFAV
jgi:hypothetical protein